MKRHVCVITGTRAEYGLLKPVMEAIRKHPRLKLSLMVTGMHLSSEFGGTVRTIQEDGFAIDYTIRMHPKTDENHEMAAAIGRGIQNMSKALAKNCPDFLLILGDRTEALAAAVTGAYMNIPVAHIHGGDISKAGLDESARHAITKLAHVHFTATRSSFDRVRKLGEKKQYVFCVGAPGLDGILREELYTRSEVSRRLQCDFTQPVIIVLQHAVTTQSAQARQQIRETLAAVKALQLPTVIIYPNSDAGGRSIIREIEKIRNQKFVKVFKNLPRKDFLSCLKYCSVMVGNSSSGVIESSSFKIPVVNIGIRQEGRERSTNVLDVGHNRAAIGKAIRRALTDKNFKKRVLNCRSSYGDGKAGPRIAKILAALDIDEDLLQKQLQYG